MAVTKLAMSKINKTTHYATNEDLLDQLRIFEKQMNWSIFEILEILRQQKADCLSITKEKPFHYFYARLSGKQVLLVLQTSEQETEFRIPIEAISKPK